MPIYALSIGLNGLYTIIGGIDPWKNMTRLDNTYRYSVELPFPDPRDGIVMEYNSKGYVEYGNEAKEKVNDTPSFPFRLKLDLSKVRGSSSRVDLLRIHPDGTIDVSVNHFPLGGPRTHLGIQKHTNNYEADFIQYLDAEGNTVDPWSSSGLQNTRP
ncbi:uncharacterized protein RJT20DRAFT_128464 [Scheffersomyces xylosifermentans]|uniref:uncharacterized protein n=1 Tax=Scheffersomyces xylosifermentans TaxID=1304137 RepID=UPI00315D62EB